MTKVFAIFIILLIIGCNVINDSKNGTSSAPCKRTTTELKIALQNGNFYDTLTANNFYLDSTTLQWISYNKFSSNTIDEYVNSILNNPLQKISSASFCILYYDTTYNNLDTLKYASLKAISVYSLKQKHYLYELFIKQNGIYQKQKNLSGITYAISVFPFISIGANIIFKDKKRFSYFILSKIVDNNSIKIVGDDLLEERLNKYAQNNNVSINFPPK